MFWIGWITDSLYAHIFTEFAQAKAARVIMIKIAIHPIVVIREKIGWTHAILARVAHSTITRSIILTNQTSEYHKIKSFSSSEKLGLNLKLFFTKGAKNINPAIAESFASDDMMFCCVSIVNK